MTDQIEQRIARTLQEAKNAVPPAPPGAVDAIKHAYHRSRRQRARIGYAAAAAAVIISIGAGLAVAGSLAPKGRLDHSAEASGHARQPATKIPKNFLIYERLADNSTEEGDGRWAPVNFAADPPPSIAALRLCSTPDAARFPSTDKRGATYFGVTAQAGRMVREVVIVYTDEAIAIEAVDEQRRAVDGCSGFRDPQGTPWDIRRDPATIEPADEAMWVYETNQGHDMRPNQVSLVARRGKAVLFYNDVRSSFGAETITNLRGDAGSMARKMCIFDADATC